jgi:branched-chain amino acid transport system substrate-binding protein
VIADSRIDAHTLENHADRPEFRAALRDAIESEREIAGVHGVFNMSPTDHSGFDKRARVLLQVQGGQFKVIAQ